MNKLAKFRETVQKVTVPDRRTWWSTLVRVSAILLVAGAVLFLVDWGLLRGVLGLQSMMVRLDESWVSWIYLSLLTLTGLLASIGVLSQQGDSAGLSSMLGSSMQSGDVTGRVGNRVAMLTVVLGVLFVTLAFFSPIFLEGMLA